MKADDQPATTATDLTAPTLEEMARTMGEIQDSLADSNAGMCEIFGVNPEFVSTISIHASNLVDKPVMIPDPEPYEFYRNSVLPFDPMAAKRIPWIVFVPMAYADRLREAMSNED